MIDKEGYLRIIKAISYTIQLYKVLQNDIFEIRTLRYQLRSREIYADERTPINSPEILTEPPQMQDDSPNTIQEMPNRQFRLFLSVMPCMPCKDSLNLLTVAPPLPYLAPHLSQA